jgi:flagellar protein FliO/FliZ
MQSLALVLLFLALLVGLAYALRWYQRRHGLGTVPGSSANIIANVALGPQQRVVTVEVGPEGARTWLVLGVTAQSINCLHVMPAGAAPTARAGMPGR